MPVKREREYRDINLGPAGIEMKDNVVTGYATTFCEPYELFRDGNYIFLEQVAADAFNDADMGDVIMQYNHEGRVLARTSNHTLTVMPDNHGLLINANLGGTEAGRQLYEEIRGGYTSKMSFGFTVTGENWEENRNEDGTVTELRTITSVGKLYDVSAVSIPANDATEISVRAMCDGVIARAEAERLKAHEREEAREKLLLRMKLLEVES